MFSFFAVLFKYLCVCVIIIIVLLVLSFSLVPRLFEDEKLSTYECGFNPYGDMRGRFEVRFYVVAILFIVFDLELIFLFPWVLILPNLSYVGIVSMFVFLVVLVEGFIYELGSGSLEWNV